MDGIGFGKLIFVLVSHILLYSFCLSSWSKKIEFLFFIILNKLLLNKIILYNYKLNLNNNKLFKIKKCLLKKYKFYQSLF